MAWGILVPQPGMNPHPLQWKRRVLTTGPPGKSPKPSFLRQTQAQEAGNPPPSHTDTEIQVCSYKSKALFFIVCCSYEEG